MKQLLTITIFILTKVLGFAQGSMDPQYYVGKTVFIKPFDREYHTYLLKDIKRPIEDKNMVFKKPYGAESEHDSIANKYFECQGSGIHKGGGENNFTYLKLFSERTGVFYYLYYNTAPPLFVITADEKKAEDDKVAAEKDAAKAAAAERAAAFKQEFYAKRAAKAQELADIEKAWNEPCGMIKQEYDEFEREKEFSTSTGPSSAELDYATKYHESITGAFTATFHKYIKKGVSTYYLHLNAMSSTAEATREGVIIILKNGKRLVKPNAEVETDVHNNSFWRSSFIQLTAADIALLKTSPMSKFKLYDQPDEVTKPEVVYKQFLCLLTKK